MLRKKESKVNWFPRFYELIEKWTQGPIVRIPLLALNLRMLAFALPTSSHHFRASSPGHLLSKSYSGPEFVEENGWKSMGKSGQRRSLTDQFE